MNPHYCSKGHENPPGGRFCLQCGEPLAPPVNKGIYPSLLLGSRYRIVRLLGQGGFGRTYLAEDINRFNESCVLKEFAPQVQSDYVLEKAEELFEREAGVLYKLQHPQIPRFREIFRVTLESSSYLFLVQDYVEGQTYRALLDSRRHQGLQFNEAEVTQFLLQLLPVLQYIHSMGVIHRDISPDNLILRNSDWLPVLIDFGGVKQVVATVAMQPGGMSVSAQKTLLGKIGYAPDEQMRLGVVSPDSDLYALAATVLVLLTGKEPQELIDEYSLTWKWRQEVNLSPTLGTVLDKMLAHQRQERYQSASQVLQALTNNQAAFPVVPTQPPLPKTQATEVVSPAYGGGANSQTVPPKVSMPRYQPRIPVYRQTNTQSPVGKILWILLFIMVGGLSWWAGNSLRQRSSSPPQAPTSPTATNSPSPNPSVTPSTTPSPSPQLSAEEQNRKQLLSESRQKLGINADFYDNVGNQLFWLKHPDFQGRPLSNNPENAELRKEWDATAAQLLDKIKAADLSDAARQRLGSYTSKDRTRAVDTVNKLHLSSRALNDLTDAKYASLFSDYSAKNLNLEFDQFLKKPMGQIWQAITVDKVQAIQAGTALERIVFDPGATGKQVSGTLKPGDGKAYIAGLNKDQLLEVNLQANPKMQLSIYPPISSLSALLTDSTDRNWSGPLSKSGFYEFVVTSTASEPLDYQLNITAKNPTPPATPSAEPSPSATATPTPSDSPSPSPGQ